MPGKFADLRHNKYPPEQRGYLYKKTECGNALRFNILTFVR